MGKNKLVREVAVRDKQRGPGPESQSHKQITKGTHQKMKWQTSKFDSQLNCFEKKFARPTTHRRVGSPLNYMKNKNQSKHGVQLLLNRLSVSEHRCTLAMTGRSNYQNM